MKKVLSICLLCACCLFFAGAFAEGEKMPAEQFTFELAAEETQYIENLIFDQPVTISGDYGQIFFANCGFQADVILTADAFTRVFILPDTTVNGSLVLKNNVKEGNWFDTAFPKFITYVPVPVVCEDCIGVVFTPGTFDTVFNGETYHLSDATLFYDSTKPEEGFVPYEGQEANCYMVGQWWENGEKVILVECEYDSEM